MMSSFPASSASSLAPAATAAPGSFSLSDARLRLFGSKAEYLAYVAAWKAFVRSPRPAVFYAMHALLTGRDLYKAFSPSKRPHDVGQPYISLCAALHQLSLPHKNQQYFRAALADFSYEHAQALRTAMERATSVAASLNFREGSVEREALLTGHGRLELSLSDWPVLDNPAIPSAAQSLEG